MEPVVIEWFDDLTLGMRFKTAGKLVTRENIKRFASEFDPQPYHLDEMAAVVVVRDFLDGSNANAIEGPRCLGLAYGGNSDAIDCRCAPAWAAPTFGAGVEQLRRLAPDVLGAEPFRP
jgi:hypothetical protein